MEQLFKKNINGYEKLLSRTQLSKVLGVSPRTITELTKEGLPVIYLGRVQRVRRGAHPRYDLEEVKSWLRERTRSAHQ